MSTQNMSNNMSTRNMSSRNMSPKKLSSIILAVVASSIFASSISAHASITEIRQDFFQQTSDIAATPIMSGPTSEDGSYLIAVYESAASATAIPTLRWTDENGVAQSTTPTSCSTVCQILAFIRVEAGTQPTIETNGYSGTAAFSLYVSGLGFWPDGTDGQAGLSEVTGFAVTDKVIYTAAHSISGLLVALSDYTSGQEYFTWWDEDGERTVSMPYEASVVTPIRMAAGTELRIYELPPQSTSLWYGLVLFGIPTSGSGPFADYELNLLDWTNASYPYWQTVFTSGDSELHILVATNIAEQPNSGSVEESLGITGVGGVDPSPCPNGFLAAPSGSPIRCTLPFTVGANTAVQAWTVNQTGTPWGVSPEYSAEIDVLQF
jgi:hypothetical protein